MCQKTKKKVMIEQLAVKYHPDFIAHEETAKVLSRHFDVTGIFEEAIEHVGGIKFIDDDHCDFSDGTEAKTASVTEVRRNGIPSTNYYSGSVTNVTTPAGITKTGDIRLGVFNQYHERMDYFYLPYHVWTSVYTCGGQNTLYTSGRIPISYNVKRDEYSFARKSAQYNLDAFKCENFEEMAKITPIWAAANLGPSYGLYLSTYQAKYTQIWA